MRVFTPSVLAAIQRNTATLGAPVVVGALQSVITVNLGFVNIDQVLFVQFQGNGSKGATGGNLNIKFAQDSGPGNFDLFPGGGNFNWSENVPASEGRAIPMSFIGVCIAAGNFVLGVEASSLGSDFTFNAGTTYIRTMLIQR